MTDEGRKKTVLVVDDDDNLRELAAMQLGADFSILKAANGEEALASIRAQKPDAIVLDMMMPGLSGKDVLQALRSDASARGIAVVVITAFNFSEEEVAAIAREPGVRAVLHKPVSFERLRRSVHEALGEAAGPA